MTTGQRIAELRKQQNLSQEALGELLGVTRQSISKWESDAALPEVEKLVAMSRLFRISVGALLGVEEPAGEAEGAELTDTQLKMAEEIAGRYIAALPAPREAVPTPRRRRLVKVCLAAGALCLAAILWSLSAQLDRLEDQFGGLSSSMVDMQSGINQQIAGITERVEAAVSAQADRFLDFQITLEEVDVAAETLTFRLRAQPKARTEDTAVAFLAENVYASEDSAWAPVRVPAQPEADGLWFSAALTCPLEGDIRFSGILEEGGVRETQVLQEWYPASTRPRLWVRESAALLGDQALPGEPFSLGPLRVAVDVDPAEGDLPYAGETPTLDGDQVRVGLYRNDDLILWGEPADAPRPGPDAAAAPEDPAQQSTWYFLIPEAEITLEEGDLLWIVAQGTDSYGREILAADTPLTISGGTLQWAQGDLSFRDRIWYHISS